MENGTCHYPSSFAITTTSTYAHRSEGDVCGFCLFRRYVHKLVWCSQHMICLWALRTCDMFISLCAHVFHDTIVCMNPLVSRATCTGSYHVCHDCAHMPTNRSAPKHIIWSLARQTCYLFINLCAHGVLHKAIPRVCMKLTIIICMPWDSGADSLALRVQHQH